MGCDHTQSSTHLIPTFRDAVRLQIALRAGQSDFCAFCDTCHSGGAPICCLECDFVGCPRHHKHNHQLGIIFSQKDTAMLWCFQCADVILDEKFEREAHEVIVESRNELGSEKIENGDSGLPKNLLALDNTKNGVPFHTFEGLRGLVNMGATCYASVVLQSLVHNPLVRTYFLAGGHQHELCTRSSCLACGVDHLFLNFFGSSSTQGFGITDLLVSMAEKQPVMGAGSTEQDAHEFYLMLLNEFHNASHAAEPQLSQSLGVKSDDTLKCQCVTHRSFSGSIESTLYCECGYTASRKEPIVDLGVNLPAQSTELNLEDCLQRFTVSENVHNYVCEKCGQPSTTSKQLRISQPPPILLVQLKRFKHLGSKGSSKIDTPVKFGLLLDLAPYMIDGPDKLIYELYGVICHIGTLDTGHYTCMMKHSSGQWFDFDDATVTAINVDTVLKTPRAYLLCYVVKDAL